MAALPCLCGFHVFSPVHRESVCPLTNSEIEMRSSVPIGWASTEEHTGFQENPLDLDVPKSERALVPSRVGVPGET